jgi:hypothetical protein
LTPATRQATSQRNSIWHGRIGRIASWPQSNIAIFDLAVSATADRSQGHRDRHRQGGGPCFRSPAGRSALSRCWGPGPTPERGGRAPVIGSKAGESTGWGRVVVAIQPPAGTAVCYFVYPS